MELKCRGFAVEIGMAIYNWEDGAAAGTRWDKQWPFQEEQTSTEMHVCPIQCCHKRAPSNESALLLLLKR